MPLALSASGVILAARRTSCAHAARMLRRAALAAPTAAAKTRWRTVANSAAAAQLRATASAGGGGGGGWYRRRCAAAFASAPLRQTAGDVYRREKHAVRFFHRGESLRGKWRRRARRGNRAAQSAAASGGENHLTPLRRINVAAASLAKAAGGSCSAHQRIRRAATAWR